MDDILDRVYRGIRFVLDDLIGNCAAFVLLMATVLALAEIVRRYIFGVVFDWGQDLVTYMIVGSVFLFFGVVQGKRAHLVMGAAIDALRAKGFARLIQWLRAFVSLVSLTLFVGFVWWGWPTVERTMMMNRKTQSMVLELWPFQACLLAGFGLMALVTLFQLYQDIRALQGKTVFPWAPSEETTDI
jgi:TRAP-type C4-dicarboxylate transport system permease small subunit